MRKQTRENAIRAVIFIIGAVVGIVINLSFLVKPETKIIERAVNSVEQQQPVNDGLLAAPKFLQPGVLNSDATGSIYVVWTPIEGAMGYNVRVFDTEGKQLKNFSIKRNITTIDGLYVNPKTKQTPYKIQVAAVGPNQEMGHPSEMRDIAMVPMRNIAPPTIKQINTED